MKNLFVLLLWICVCRTAYAQPSVSGYDFSWGDEFSGAALDTSKWTAGNTNVPTNNSRQDYLPEQVTVSGGNLVITSENTASRGLPYKSGLVQSNSVQKHGRWDVRAKLPTSKGMWPAIWLLGDTPNWPSLGEIDIMENRGDSPTIVSSAFHYGTNPPFVHNYLTQEHQAIHDGISQNYHAGFHNYSVEWDPAQIRFYVDNVHHFTVRDSDVGGFLSNNVGDMRLIMNTAIGGDFLDNPDGSTVWPQKFEIDYVHVYTKASTGPVLTFENGGFEKNGGSMSDWSVFGNPGNNVSSANEYIDEGAEALKLYGQFSGEPNYSGVEQGITIQGGEELVAKASSFVTSLDSISGTSNSVELKIDYYSKAYGQFGTGEYLGSDSITIANGSTFNNIWHDFELSSTAPLGAVEARLAIVFSQLNGQGGAVWVDGVSFGVVGVPEPATALILGFGTIACFLKRRRPIQASP